MIFTRSAILLFLVFQLHQIAAKDSCGVETGPAFKPNENKPYIAEKTEPSNFPWSVILNCVVEQNTRFITIGAVISKRYGIFFDPVVDGKCSSNKYSVTIPDNAEETLTIPVETLKRSDRAPLFVVAKLTREIVFGNPVVAACLPYDLKTESLVSKYIYTFTMGTDITNVRTTVQSMESCVAFPDKKYDKSFCSDYNRTQLHVDTKGQPATIKQDGKHVLVGLVVPRMIFTQLYYANIIQVVNTIQEFIKDDVVNTANENSVNSAGKPSTIFEVVSKHANK